MSPYPYILKQYEIIYGIIIAPLISIVMEIGYTELGTVSARITK
jgi:hypothetical protein